MVLGVIQSVCLDKTELTDRIGVRTEDMEVWQELVHKEVSIDYWMVYPDKDEDLVVEEAGFLLQGVQSVGTVVVGVPVGDAVHFVVVEFDQDELVAPNSKQLADVDDDFRKTDLVNGMDESAVQPEFLVFLQVGRMDDKRLDHRLYLLVPQIFECFLLECKLADLGTYLDEEQCRLAVESQDAVAVEQRTAGGCKPVVEKKKMQKQDLQVDYDEVVEKRRVQKLDLSVDYDGVVFVLFRQENWMGVAVQVASAHLQVHVLYLSEQDER